MRKLKYILVAVLILPITGESQNKVWNFTDRENYETLERTFLKKLHIENVTVYMTEIYNEKMAKNNVYAFVNAIKKDLYLIVFSEAMPDSLSSLVLAHETIHIWQQEIGIYEEMGDGIIKYKGKLYDIKQDGYLERQWELDAFKWQWQLLNLVK